MRRSFIMVERLRQNPDKERRKFCRLSGCREAVRIPESRNYTTEG